MADDDVEFTGAAGDDIARNAPHSRQDCLVHKHDKSDQAACKLACAQCYCWVCDDVWTKCSAWDEHCLCDGSVTWLQERQRVARRKKEAEEQAKRAESNPTGAATGADEVNARYARAASGEAEAEGESEGQSATEQRGEDEETEELFAQYTPAHYKEGQPHPDAVVETTSLSFAEMPTLGYTLSLPKGLLKPKTDANPIGGALSNLQLETVLYACQRHEQRLPSGARAGFFLGDGVGLGKGRQLAGIILENWSKGRRRHVWCSVSSDLCVDARRDLDDIGAQHITVRNMTDFPLARRIQMSEGVLFMTYMALVSKGDGNKRRLDQILKWLKEDDPADGCVLFDEAHKAKNLVPDESKISQKTGRVIKGKVSSKTADAVHELQEQLPETRFVYCSATGASDISHMAYMERLGLWGQGTSFADFPAFYQAIGKGGTGAMELVALDMKRLYISRQLSFASAEFQTEIVDLDKHRYMYDKAAAFWQTMHGCIEHALISLGVKHQPGHPAKRMMSYFWGCHQRFFRQMCMSMKVDRCIEIAQDALKKNKCVVIGLQSTGEARLLQAVKDDVDLDEFCGMEAILSFVIERFPTGDVEGLYPEPDSDDDAGDGGLNADEIGGFRVEGVRRRRAAWRGRRGSGAGPSRGGEVDSDGMADDGSDLDDFIDDRDEDEISEGEMSEDEDGLARARRGKLPKVVRKLSMQRMRALLSAQGIEHKNCTDKRQLLARLQQLEERSRSAASNLEVDACISCKCYSTAEMLMCDKKRPDGQPCNKVCHTYCCSPPLKAPPAGEWFCADCAPEAEPATRRTSGAGGSSPSTDDAGEDMRPEGTSSGARAEADQREPRRKSSGADTGSAINLDSEDEMAEPEEEDDEEDEREWEPRAGAEVELRGLEKRPELNGKRGKVLGAATGQFQGRWEVEVLGEPKKLALRPENIIKAPRPRAAAPSARPHARPTGGTTPSGAAAGAGDAVGGSVGESGGALLGQRIKVLWTDKKLVTKPTWFEGEVVSVSSSRGHKVRYDDGEEKWEDLDQLKWSMLSSRKAPGVAGSAAKRPRRSVVESDEEEEEEETAPPRARRSAKAAGKRKAEAPKAKKGGRRRASEDSDDSDGSWKGSSDEEEDEAGDSDEQDLGLSSDDEKPSKRPRGGAGGSAKARFAKAKRAGKGKARRGDETAESGDEVDSLLGDDGDRDDADEPVSYQCGNSALIKELQGLKRQLKQLARKLKLPDAPLDRLIWGLGGPEQVAELTGRTGRLERDEQGKTQYKRRNVDLDVAMKEVNIAERKNFQEGRKHVAIISEAASSGISLQADRRVANQAQRVHITLELPWSADQAIQQCGRTHRSNQVCGPRYVLMMTAAGGERRFASAVAKRLRALGALTKGDRRAADASNLSDFDVDTDYGRMAASQLLETVLHPMASKMHPPQKYVYQVLGLNRSDLQNQWGEYLDEAEETLARLGMKPDDRGVKKFLNRLLGVQIDMQNKVFAHFFSLFEQYIKVAKENFEFNDGVVDIQGQSGVNVEPGYPLTLASDGSRPLLHWKLQQDRGICFADAKRLLVDHRRANGGVLAEGEGFWRSRNRLPNYHAHGVQVYHVCLTLRKPTSAWSVSNPIPIYKLLRPSTGLGKPLQLEDIRSNFMLVWPRPRVEGRPDSSANDEIQANELWTKCYDTFLHGCAHGPNCSARRRGVECYVGRRRVPRHVLTGSVLPHWGPLQELVGYTSVPDRSENARPGAMKQISNMSIVRVRADTAAGSSSGGGAEQRLVGVEVQLDKVGGLKRALDPAARAAAAAAAAAGGGSSSGDVKPRDVKPNLKPKKSIVKPGKAAGGVLEAMRKKREAMAAAASSSFDLDDE